jgi:hypothetical protein
MNGISLFGILANVSDLRNSAASSAANKNQQKKKRKKTKKMNAHCDARTVIENIEDIDLRPESNAGFAEQSLTLVLGQFANSSCDFIDVRIAVHAESFGCFLLLPIVHAQGDAASILCLA